MNNFKEDKPRRRAYYCWSQSLMHLREGKSLFKPGPPGPMAIHPLRKIWCKLQVKRPSEYTYSLIWAELSRLLGEEIPVAIVGLEPWTPGSVVQHFNHLASKQPHLNTSLVVVCCCTFSGSASHHCYGCCWFGLLPRRLQ